MVLFLSRSSTQDYAKTRITSPVRDGPRDPRHADTTNASDGPRPRPDHCTCYRAWLGRCPSNRARFAVSSVAPTPEPRVDRGILGNVRKQSQGEVLPADAGRPKTTRGADVPLGTSGAPSDESCIQHRSETSELAAIFPSGT